jgi:hypothetical protein
LLGSKGGRCLGLTILPLSHTDCLEIWKSFGSAIALYRDCFTFSSHYQYIVYCTCCVEKYGGAIIPACIVIPTIIHPSFCVSNFVLPHLHEPHKRSSALVSVIRICKYVLGSYLPENTLVSTVKTNRLQLSTDMIGIQYENFTKRTDTF